jgi:hypothetical protein
MSAIPSPLGFLETPPSKRHRNLGTMTDCKIGQDQHQSVIDSAQ